MNETTTQESRTGGAGPVEPLVSDAVAWSSAYNAANLDVCKCYGALSHIEAAKKRLLSTSRPQHWMINHLDDAHRRMTELLGPLIRKRDDLAR
jgi:hypothetical protein